MDEVPCVYSDLNNQTLRLNIIIEINDYFTVEIRERELMSKRLSKYIAPSDCFDEALIVLFGTNGGVSIASFASVIGAPVGIASASLNFEFSLTAGI